MLTRNCQVPGDVLLVKAGNKLPADIRFTQVSSDAKFDRSILTGEFESPFDTSSISFSVFSPLEIVRCKMSLTLLHR